MRSMAGRRAGARGGGAPQVAAQAPAACYGDEGETAAMHIDCDGADRGTTVRGAPGGAPEPSWGAPNRARGLYTRLKDSRAAHKLLTALGMFRWRSRSTAAPLWTSRRASRCARGASPTGRSCFRRCRRGPRAIAPHRARIPALFDIYRIRAFLWPWMMTVRRE